MLNKAKNLKGYKLNSLDGEIGKVEEFYFDDKHWTVRYLVANTGNWLTGRQILISPYALKFVNKDERHIDINLTKKQIENSPSLETDKPVSLQFEQAYHSFYGWPVYWDGPNMWGTYPYIARDPELWKITAQEKKMRDLNLRSTRDVSGYHIRATDGEIGHVEDFIIEDETWAIRYLIIHTQNWLPGKKVLVSPQWIGSVGWGESKVFVNLSRETVRQSPEYTEGSSVTRDYENRLHQHYNRQGYWIKKNIDLERT